MSQIDAPLLTRCQDLFVWLYRRIGRWPERAVRLLGGAIVDEARALLGAVRLALVFPQRRRWHQQAADEALGRLRGLIAVAEAVQLLTADAVAHLAVELTEIGRMLGGWRKRWRRATAA